MTRLDMMILRLYIGPVFLMLVAAVAQYMAGNLEENGKANMMAGIIANGLAPVIYWAVLGLLAWAALWMLYSSWRLWNWFQGSGEPCCHVCGGLVNLHDGRYGLYYRCLACGNTRKA